MAACSIAPYEPPVFAPDDNEDICTFLSEYGYVVVQALSPAEVVEAENVFWEEAGTMGWYREVPQSWAAKDKFETMAGRSDCGHIKGWDHSAFLWHLRKSSGVQRTYANVCARLTETPKEDQRLLASFNSINIFRPHGLNPAWRTTSSPWFHIDNPKPDPGMPLKQQRVVFPGVVNLMDVSPDTGGFCCIPKSHLQFGVLDRDAGEYLDVARYTNFIDSEPNQLAGNKSYTQPVLICTGGRRGTLLLWDPRLVHCSTASLTPSERNPRACRPELLRLAAWVSMCPRTWAMPDDLSARYDLVKERMCINSHIPYAVLTQRRIESMVFYEDVWTDAAALEMIGTDVDQEE